MQRIGMVADRASTVQLLETVFDIGIGSGVRKLDEHAASNVIAKSSQSRPTKRRWYRNIYLIRPQFLTLVAAPPAAERYFPNGGAVKTAVGLGGEFAGRTRLSALGFALREPPAGCKI